MRFKDLRGDERGDVIIHCPLHHDRNPSAAVNFQKNLFNCFVCGGMTIDKLKETLGDEDDLTEFTVVEEPDIQDRQLDVWELAEKTLESRGVLSILEGDNPPCSISVPDNPNDSGFGYLFFHSNGVRVGRSLVGKKARYYNDPNFKGLFVLEGSDLSADHVWLTEGIFDALSLRKCGIQNAVALLGSGAKEERLFPLKGKTVFILFDNDWPGFKGAKEIYDNLLTIEANPIIISLPEEWNDVNDALQEDEMGLKEFISKTLSQFDTNDKEFVSGMATMSQGLTILPSGIGRLDSILGGGFKEGLHVIGAEPGVGKTAFCSHLVTMAYNKGQKVLVNTCEVSKLQYWCRIASSFSRHSWSDIEFNPAMLESSVKEQLKYIADTTKIVHGWELEKVLFSIDKYDVVVVDYLQVMPSPIVDSQVKTKKIIQALANVASQKGKVIICISSLSRHGYDDQGLGIFKESGDIEYSAESAIKISPAFHNPNLSVFDVRKNRRGVTGKVDASVNLEHCVFGDLDYNLIEKVNARGEDYSA